MLQLEYHIFNVYYLLKIQYSLCSDLLISHLWEVTLLEFRKNWNVFRKPPTIFYKTSCLKKSTIITFNYTENTIEKINVLLIKC